MKLKGVVLLDTEFNPVEIPNIYTVDEWDKLILNTDYIYLDNDDAVVLWNEHVMKWDSYTKSPFYKPGAYMWDTSYEKWIHIWDKVAELQNINSTVGKAYAKTVKLPLEDCEEK